MNSKKRKNVHIINTEISLLIKKCIFVIFVIQIPQKKYAKIVILIVMLIVSEIQLIMKMI